MKKLRSIKIYLFAVVIAVCFSACKSKKSNLTNVGASGNKFDNLYIDACAQYNIGNYTVALQKFISCANLKPQEASVYFQLSRINNTLKNSNEALLNASKANKLAPSNKFYAQHYADYLRQIGQYKEAIAVLETALKSNLRDETIYNELVHLYGLMDNTKAKQINLYKQYIENVGFKPTVALKIIALYNEKKDFESAHLIYAQLKKASPKKVQYYIDDAIIYQLQNDETNAMLNYEKAMELNPNNWQVNYSLYKFYLNKKEDLKAKKYFLQAFEDGNTTFETKTKACQDLLKDLDAKIITNEYGGIAAAALEKIYPTNANAIYTGAILYEKISEKNAALKAFENSVTINPNMYDAWLGATKNAEQLNSFSKVTMLSEKAIEYFPNIALLYIYAANGYNTQKQYEKAFQHACNGIRYVIEDIDRAGLLIQKGISLYGQKKFNAAKENLIEAITLNIENAIANDKLGNAFYQLNDIGKALEYWQKAKKLGLNNEWIDKKILEKKLYE